MPSKDLKGFCHILVTEYLHSTGKNNNNNNNI